MAITGFLYLCHYQNYIRKGERYKCISGAALEGRELIYVFNHVPESAIQLPCRISRRAGVGPLRPLTRQPPPARAARR